MSDTRAVWVERVEAWRESGERAEEFSRHEDFSAATLRWWASKLKRETAPDDVRLARVLRTPTEKQVGGAIVIELIRSGTRVSIEAGADKTTLSMVLELLGLRVGDEARS
jgi:hypothetical protein